MNDANAVFQHAGVFHIMHQCDGGPPGVPCGGGWEGPNPHPLPGEQVIELNHNLFSHYRESRLLSLTIICFPIAGRAGY